MASFNTLPPELHVEIMGHLEHQSLLRCSSTCRSLYTLSKSSSRLLYIIELGMSGMLDSGSQLEPIGLLSKFHDLRVAWENIEWTHFTKLKIEEDCLAYELVAGVFALSNGLGLKSISLPSAKKEPSTLERRSLGILVRDFAIDPTQDLVAILEDDHTPVSFGLLRHVHIHIRTISTNEHHELAAQDILSFAISPDPEYGNVMTSAMLQLTNDLLALFLSKGQSFSAKCRALIWNWQKGTLIYDSEGPTRTECLPQHINDFSLLSRTSFVMTSALNSGALHIYIFSPSDTLPTQPKLVASLHLPPIRPTYRIHKVGIHSGPFHAYPPKNSLFYSSHESGIQVVSITYAIDEPNSPGSSNFSLFVYTKTLLDYTRRPESNTLALATDNPSEVEWDQWGETKTRLFPTRTPMHWLRYVHGQRVVCSSSDNNVVDILDFNYNPHFNSVHRLQDLISQPSISYPTYLFQEGLITRLPYYMSRRTIPDRFYACMIDQERLIGLKMEDDNGMELHVYSF